MQKFTCHEAHRAWYTQWSPSYNSDGKLDRYNRAQYEHWKGFGRHYVLNGKTFFLYCSAHRLSRYWYPVFSLLLFASFVRRQCLLTTFLLKLNIFIFAMRLCCSGKSFFFCFDVCSLDNRLVKLDLNDALESVSTGWISSGIQYGVATNYWAFIPNCFYSVHAQR